MKPGMQGGVRIRQCKSGLCQRWPIISQVSLDCATLGKNQLSSARVVKSCAGIRQVKPGLRRVGPEYAKLSLGGTAMGQDKPELGRVGPEL